MRRQYNEIANCNRRGGYSALSLFFCLHFATFAFFLSCSDQDSLDDDRLIIEGSEVVVEPVDFAQLQGTHRWTFTYDVVQQAFLQCWDPSLICITPDSIHFSYGVDAIDANCQPLGIQYLSLGDYPIFFSAPNTLSIDGVPYLVSITADRGYVLWNEEKGGYKLEK